MGRPINKRNIGTPGSGNEIKVQFHNGTSSVAGWIVKQSGSKKFHCTDGSVTKVCFLADVASGSLAAGQMSVTINGGDRVTKISNRLVTANGVSQKWNFDGSGSAAEIEEAGTDTTLTGADDFEGDEGV